MGPLPLRLAQELFDFVNLSSFMTPRVFFPPPSYVSGNATPPFSNGYFVFFSGLEVFQSNVPWRIYDDPHSPLFLSICIEPPQTPPIVPIKIFPPREKLCPGYRHPYALQNLSPELLSLRYNFKIPSFEPSDILQPSYVFLWFIPFSTSCSLSNSP